MNARTASNPRGRRALARLVLFLALLPAGACSSPLGGRDLDLTFSAQALPGIGAGVALAQRLFDQESRRIDFEVGVDRQDLSEAGPEGDRWTRAWAGLRCAARETPAQSVQWQGRLGVNWLRTEGRAGTLEDPGDYGGAYLGLGLLWELGPALATGPDLTLLYVDSEGSRSGSGGLAEFAWRWVWHL